MECYKEEAVREKGIAEQRLRAGDYEGALKIAQKAQRLFAELDNISQILAVCNVHCSAKNKINGSDMDWYAILQIELFSDENTVKKQYRKLALLLHPDKNKFAGAEAAFKLIGEANSVLADQAKRSQYDKKCRAQMKASPKPPTDQSNTAAPKPPSEQSNRATPKPPTDQSNRAAPKPPTDQSNTAAPKPPSEQSTRATPKPPPKQSNRAAPTQPPSKRATPKPPTDQSNTAAPKPPSEQSNRAAPKPTTDQSNTAAPKPPSEQSTSAPPKPPPSEQSNRSTPKPPNRTAPKPQSTQQNGRVSKYWGPLFIISSLALLFLCRRQRWLPSPVGSRKVPFKSNSLLFLLQKIKSLRKPTFGSEDLNRDLFSDPAACTWLC